MRGEDASPAEEAAVTRAAPQRRGAGGEGEGDERELPREAAHAPQVLLVMQGEDDRARAHEEERP